VRAVRALWLAATLLVAPAAHAADTCHIALGRGWPPATENYGTAVEKLFAVGSTPALSFTLLPRTGAETGLLLIADPKGGDWNLRYSVADERVHYWNGNRLEFRTAQTPDIQEVPMPAAVASRLVEDWRRALTIAAPAGSTAPFSENDSWLFVAGDLRVSGLRPECELGEQLREQIDLLIEASDEGEEKREKRWRQLGQSLDRMRATLDAMSTNTAP